MQVTCVTREHFQAELDALSDGDKLDLNVFEYPGPVIIRRAVTIDGHGATLWALQGPVCQIECQGVTLKNLKIEVTQEELASGDSAGGCALSVVGAQACTFDNVEVRGSVLGRLKEQGEWRYPYSLRLNEIPHGQEHRFLVRLYVPVPCTILSAMHGVSVAPDRLSPGRNVVTLTVECLPEGALLLGTLYLHSDSLKRQISVSGHVVRHVQPGTESRDGKVVYSPADWDRLDSARTQREPWFVGQETSDKPPPVTSHIKLPKTREARPCTHGAKLFDASRT